MTTSFKISGLSKVTQMLSSVINKVTQQRAVAAQANVTAGAMNASLQSTMQTQRDKAMQDRRAFLLGQKQVHEIGALEALDMPTGDDPHDPSHPRKGLRRRRRSSR